MPIRIPPSHSIGLLLALLAPMVAIDLLLILSGALDPTWGLATLPVLVFSVWLVVRPALQALLAAQAHAEALAERARDDDPLPDPPVLALRLPIAQELVTATSQLARSEQARRREVAALMASRAALIDVLPDAIVGLSRDGRVQLANAAARALIGAGAVGRDVGAVLRAPAILDAIEAAQRHGETQEVEWEQVAPVQRHFVVRVQPAPSTPDGITVIAALADVTDERRAERLRADFVANASHELRTPLATLVGFIETLLGPARDDPEAQAQFLAIMQDQAQRMARLVEDLLSLSRIEQSEHVPPTQRVDLAAVVERVVRGLALQADKRRMAIEFTAQADIPPVVGSEPELVQLTQNLVENAIKYGRAGTPIRIDITRVKDPPAGFPRDPRGAVQLAVVDQGEGVARAHIPRLTERFYRVDVGRSREAGGTGLGLAIVKHIVTRHRGLLAIESEVGRGSQFSVYLPAAAATGGV